MKTLITTHNAMDLDSLGALIAARKLYPESVVVLIECTLSIEIPYLRDDVFENF